MGQDGDSSLLALRPLARELLASIVLCGPNVSSLFNFPRPPVLRNQGLAAALASGTYSDQPSAGGVGVLHCVLSSGPARAVPREGHRGHRRIQHHCLHVIDGG